jgi:RNA polymerase nonessential primary-like sigma factor
LTADEENEMATTVRQAQYEMLALALESPGVSETLVGWLNRIDSGRALPPSVLPRPRPGTSPEGRTSTRAAFVDWCRAVIDAGPDAPLATHEALAARHLLADDARDALVRNATPDLSPGRARRSNELRHRLEATRARFVEHNQGLVVRCAQAYVNRGLPLADLVQEGNLGLLRAVSGFDPALGYRFSTYAVWWIRHTLGRALDTQSRTIRLPVHASEEYRLLRRAQDRSKLVGEGTLADAELAKRAGVSLQRVREFNSAPGQPVSYDAGQPGDLPLLERIADADAEDPLTQTLRVDVAARLRQALAELEPREREMVRMRYGLQGCAPHTLKEVGSHFGVTRERARQIVGAVCARLRSLAELHGSCLPG